jgi:hypothetical protein
MRTEYLDDEYLVEHQNNLYLELDDDYIPADATDAPMPKSRGPAKRQSGALQEGGVRCQKRQKS